MSYLDRLRPASFIAPSGDEIFFRVDTLERSGGKKGATQEVLDSIESISQDVGNKATNFPIDAYFPGADYDRDVDAFYEALEQKYSQSNPGILKHPRWGDIPVMPFDWTQREELVSGTRVGRVTVSFTRLFPQVFPFTDGRSTDEALKNLDEIEAESEEIAAGMDTSSIGAAANIAGKIQGAVGIISNNIRAVTNAVQSVQDQFDAIQSGIDDIIDDVAGNIVELVAATQRLIRTPGRIIDETQAKINGYRDMVTQLTDSFNDDSETSIVNRRNNAIMLQLFAGLGVGGVAEAAVFTEFGTRPQAVDAIDIINESAETFTAGFDEARTSGNVVQEFSGDHNVFSLIQDTATRVNEIVLNQAFDLKAEKRFTLKNKSDVITECYSAYGTVSSDKVEFFIDTNKIVGDEYIELAPGRELVTYV
jgi:prophage DNA circulation protein